MCRAAKVRKHDRIQNVSAKNNSISELPVLPSLFYFSVEHRYVQLVAYLKRFDCLSKFRTKAKRKVRTPFLIEGL